MTRSTLGLACVESAMPLECIQLAVKPEPLRKCPRQACGAQPFKAMLRGLVHRSPSGAPFAYLAALVQGYAFPYCAVICSKCAHIVDYEAP